MLSIGPIATRPISTSGSSAGVTQGVTNYNSTFSGFTSDDFYDWNTPTGSPSSYDSFLHAYYIVPEEAMTWMQSPYVYVFMDSVGQEFVVDSEFTEIVDSNGTTMITGDVGCLMNAVWDWSNTDEEEIVLDSDSSTVVDSSGAIIVDDITSPKASRDIQLYRFRDGYSIAVSKNKIRGRGKVLQLRFNSQEGKDFNLLGWTAWISKNMK